MASESTKVFNASGAASLRFSKLMMISILAFSAASLIRLMSSCALSRSSDPSRSTKSAANLSCRFALMFRVRFCADGAVGSNRCFNACNALGISWSLSKTGSLACRFFNTEARGDNVPFGQLRLTSLRNSRFISHRAINRCFVPARRYQMLGRE